MFGFRIHHLLGVSLLFAVTSTSAANTSASPSAATFCADIQISQRQLRADGVEITERYHERLYRTDTVIAFERVLPAARQRSAAPAHDHGHQHDHPDQLIRRYEKLPNGQLVYSLFDDGSQREIQLQPNEFDEFGFDGNFAALHALVDPALLASLGNRDQTLRQSDGELRWSGRDRIVRSVQRRGADGDYQMTVTATASCSDPRHARQGYAVIDYADTLD